jgi:hypothetical protein
MKRSSAVSVVAAFAPAAAAEATGEDAGAVEALRRRLGDASAREHVVLDFLEDDLRDARAALAGVAAWLSNVERALAESEPSQQRLLCAARGGTPAERVEALSSALASVRRRVAQVAARM